MSEKDLLSDVMGQELHTQFEKVIFKERGTEIAFDELVKDFETAWESLKNRKHLIDVSEHFGDGKGPASSFAFLSGSRSDLLERKKDCDENEIKDFPGIYAFFHDDKPYYVGISRGVIKRIQQHIKGTTHFSASLAFKMAVDVAKQEGKLKENEKDGSLLFFANEKVSEGERLVRKELQDKLRDGFNEAKTFLKNSQVNFMRIDNSDQRALFEIYCAMQAGLYLNSFETH